MQLSKFSDYSFRALIYLAHHNDELCTVDELAKALNTSEHHMKKVCTSLRDATMSLFFHHILFQGRSRKGW